jgi:hypothetical protein
MQLKGHDCNDETYDEIRSLGIKYVRKGIYWNSVEKEKGAYDFGWCDGFFKDVSERGFAVLGCLFSGNALYEDPKPGGIRTEAGRKGFAGFAAALAERYKDRKVIWEIWNEPNVRTFWGRHGKAQHNSDEYAGEYTALVKEVVPAMRRADPDCVVVAGSVSNLWSASYRWIEYCFKRGIHESGISGWSLHPYSVPVDHYPEAYDKVRKILAKYGAGDLPLLNTERGFPTKEAEGWAGGDPSNASAQLQYHAWHFVRQYLIDRMCDVKLTIWYQWRGGGFGMVDGGKQRPACAACRVLVGQLNGYRYRERLPADSPLDFLLVFEDGSGARKLVAWTAPGPKESPDKARVHDVTVRVGAASGPLAACDIYGNQMKLAASGGEVTLTLSGAPQYVTLREGRKSASPPGRRSRRASAETMEEWDARLLARVREEVKAGRRPGFFMSSTRGRAQLTAVEGESQLRIKVGGGVEVSMPLTELSPADRKNLALAVVREGVSADQCLAGFYLLAAGEGARAEELLQEAAPADAQEVRAVFAE